MDRPHQPGQETFRAILAEDIDWQPFPALPPPTKLPHKHTEDRIDDPRKQ